MEIGVYTFGEVTFDPETGRQLNAQERLRDLIEEIELADQVGLDVFAVGEHHRPDYAVSAPAVGLAAAAERTKRIRLSGGSSRRRWVTRCEPSRGGSGDPVADGDAGHEPDRQGD